MRTHKTVAHRVHDIDVTGFLSTYICLVYVCTCVREGEGEFNVHFHSKPAI